jgi:hypothetical protein
MYGGDFDCFAEGHRVDRISLAKRQPNKRKVGIPMTNKLELKQGDKLYHDHDEIIIFPPRKQPMTEDEKEMIRIAFEKAFSEDDDDIKEPLQEEGEKTE